jgi:hypothetical protein
VVSPLALPDDLFPNLEGTPNGLSLDQNPIVRGEILQAISRHAYDIGETSGNLQLPPSSRLAGADLFRLWKL